MASEVIEQRNSQRVRDDLDNGLITQEREQEFIVTEKTPSEARWDSRIPQLGQYYNTEYETNIYMRVKHVEANRVEDAEGDVSRVRVVYRYDPGQGEQDTQPDFDHDDWLHNIEWEAEITGESEKVIAGRDDRPPNSLWAHELLNIPPAAMHPLGENGEGSDIEIPKMNLTITRREPRFFAAQLLNLQSHVNSNDNWAIPGDRRNWRFTGVRGRALDKGVEATYRFNFDPNGHQRAYWYKAKYPNDTTTGNDSEEMLWPLYSDGTPMDKSAVEVIQCGNKDTVVPFGAGCLSNVKYTHMVYVYPESDFTLFDFWEGTGPD